MSIDIDEVREGLQSFMRADDCNFCRGCGVRCDEDANDARTFCICEAGESLFNLCATLGIDAMGNRVEVEK